MALEPHDPAFVIHDAIMHVKAIAQKIPDLPDRTRHGYGLSPELPLSWPDLMAGLTQNPVIQKGEEAHG